VEALLVKPALRQKLRRITALALLIGVVACPQVGYLWLVPGATRDSVVVAWGSKAGREGRLAVAGIQFYQCGDTTLTRDSSTWIAYSELGSDTTITRIEYGRLPQGWGERHPAIPLTPGCYTARIGASPGRVSFKVDSTGAVSEVPGPS
jgi:hypothetical protein